jgi:hypothetical protein
MGWTTFSDATLAVDEPWTSAKAIGFRDNLAAVGAGTSDDTPVLVHAWHPYDKVTNGDSNDGEIYNASTDGAVATLTTPDFADGWEYQLVFVSVEHSSGSSQALQLELYRATGADWIGPTSVVTVGTGAERTLFIDILAARSARKQHVAAYVDQGGTGAVTFAFTTAQKVGKARVSFASGNLDAGKIYLYRRKAFYA